MNTHTALSVVLNQSNNELIDGINKRNRIEKIVDGIFNEFIEFIDDFTFYNDTQCEIEMFRKLLQNKHSDKLKLVIDRYDELHIKFASLKTHFSHETDTLDDTTSIIQATNAIYLLNYKSSIIDKLSKNIYTKRTTRCCGKVLNSQSKTHKCYSFYNILNDRNEDLIQNACKICRPSWEYLPIYNCELCEVRYKLFYRCFFQYICRTADVVADTKHSPQTFYGDYSREELDTAGLDGIERSNTYHKTTYDAQNEVECIDEIFDYYLDYDEDEQEEVMCYEQQKTIDDIIMS